MTYLNISDSFLYKTFYSNSCITHSWESSPLYFFNSVVFFTAGLESSTKKNQNLSSLFGLFPLKAII